MMTTDQLNASQKAQVNQWFDLMGKSLDETEKLLELNLSACRDGMDELARCYQRACDVRDMPGAFQWQSVAFKPFAEQSAQYGARLAGLASGSGREWSRNFENQWQDMTRWMTGWTALAPKSGEPGPETAFEYLRNTMKAFDSVWASARENLAQSQQAALQAVQLHKPAGKTGGARKQG